MWLALMLLLVGCSTPSKDFPDDFDLAGLSDTVQENIAVGNASGVSLFTYAGVGLFVLGALSFAFFNRSSGLQLIIFGSLCGMFPFVVQSVYFNYIIGGSLLTAAGFGLWHLWFKIRKSETDETK